MEDSAVSIIIAVVALLVSIASAAFQMYRSSADATERREQNRSSLLTQTAELLFILESHRRSTSHMLKLAREKNLEEFVTALEESEKHTISHEKEIEAAYVKLLATKKPRTEQLEKARHLVNLALMQSNELKKFENAIRERIHEKAST